MGARFSTFLDQVIFQPPEPPTYENNRAIVLLTNKLVQHDSSAPSTSTSTASVTSSSQSPSHSTAAITSTSNAVNHTNHDSANSSELQPVTSDVQPNPDNRNDPTTLTESDRDSDTGTGSKNVSLSLTTIVITYRFPTFFYNLGHKYTILFSHANAEDLGLIVDYVKYLAKTLNVNVFSYDYSGYGISERTITDAEKILQNAARSRSSHHNRVSNASGPGRGSTGSETNTGGTGHRETILEVSGSSPGGHGHGGSPSTHTLGSESPSGSSAQSSPASTPETVTSPHLLADSQDPNAKKPQTTQSSVFNDIEACYTYLTETLSIPWENIILFGRSIGTGATVHLASIAPCRGVILQAPLASLFRILFPLRLTLDLSWCGLRNVKDQFCKLEFRSCF